MNLKCPILSLGSSRIPSRERQRWSASLGIHLMVCLSQEERRSLISRIQEIEAKGFPSTPQKHRLFWSQHFHMCHGMWMLRIRMFVMFAVGMVRKIDSDFDIFPLYGALYGLPIWDGFYQNPQMLVTSHSAHCQSQHENHLGSLQDAQSRTWAGSTVDQTCERTRGPRYIRGMDSDMYIIIHKGRNTVYVYTCIYCICIYIYTYIHMNWMGD